jgi:hypothetical protein
MERESQLRDIVVVGKILFKIILEFVRTLKLSTSLRIIFYGII